MKIEARKKSTGEIRFFAEDVWAMMEKSGHARRGWDFVRKHEVKVPEEIRQAVEVADAAGQADLVAIEPAIKAAFPIPRETASGEGLVEIVKRMKKRRNKTAKTI